MDDINQLIPIDDFRGSSEYRHHLAVTLGERVLGDMS
jgi:CO/xanthine dehydrogenase FAD-binding subunit